MADKYEIKGVPVEITATARNAIELKGSWFTVEASEKRLIPQIDGIDMVAEWEDLFDSVQDVVDDQIDDIFESFKAAEAERRKRKR